MQLYNHSSSHYKFQQMKWLIISLLFINASTNLPETDAMKGFLKRAKSFNEIEKKTLKAQQFSVSKGETDFGYKH